VALHDNIEGAGRALLIPVPTVLIVEDDAAMGALLERGLRDEGYDVVRVDNGVDARRQ
jgi:CheY-like chemotaxis protein